MKQTLVSEIVSCHPSGQCNFCFGYNEFDDKDFVFALFMLS